MAIITSLDNKKCYLDIKIGGKPAGRIVFELFFDKAPLAAENFLSLCTGAGTNDQEIELSLKNNYFHRAIKNFIIQAGDLVYGKNLEDSKYPPQMDSLEQIGTGGCSIYSSNESQVAEDVKLYHTFDDENLENSTFEKTFNVAMSNNSPNSNTSQFFINTYPSPHLNHKHTIFGKVIHGKAVARAIERVQIVDKDTYFPATPVIISDCGEFTDNMQSPCFVACYDPIEGDIYEEYPDDDENFDKDDYRASYKACETIKKSGNALFKLQQFENALLKFSKGLRYLDELQPEKEVLITESNTKEQNNANYKLYIDFLQLKKSLYSNIALMYFKLARYEDSIKYSNFVIEMLEVYPKYEKFVVSTSEFVKCYFRIGKSYASMGRLEKARDAYKKAAELNPNDKSVERELENTEKAISGKKESMKKSLGKFFS